MSRPSSHDVVVRYATADGSATAGQDYAATNAELLIPAGQTSVDAHVAVHGDGAVEPHETFTVMLSDPRHATIAEAGAAVRIVDDEPVVVTVGAPEVVEGDIGTTPADFTVSITTPPAGVTVTLPWKVAAGTAEVPADVQTAEGELTLHAATTSAVVTADVVADQVAEPAPKEFFRLLVGAPTASDGRPVIVDDPRMATIVEDDVADGAPTVTAEDATGSEGSPIALRAVVTDDGPVTTTWSVDAAAGCTIADPAALETTVTCADDGTFVATITADDGTNAAASAQASVTVDNVAPSIGAAGHVDGSLTVTFSDPGADTHRCVIDFGDGTPAVETDPATSPCTAAHTYGPGSYEATVTVTDDDGASASTTVPVTVGAPTEYQWDGFFEPVDNDVVNRVQAGRAIPMKFSLGGDFGLDILADGSPTSARVACDSGAPVEVIEETVTAGSSGLHYDAAEDHCVYVWKTLESWQGQCRQFALTLDDGSTHRATFQFR